MQRLLVVLVGLSSLACASCSEGDDPVAGKSGNTPVSDKRSLRNDGEKPEKGGDDETSGTEDEQVAVYKKIFTDPKLRKKLEERVPDLRSSDWVDKNGKKHSDDELDSDRGAHDESSIVEELTLNGGEVRYEDGVVTTIILTHKLRTPMKVVDPGLCLLKFLPGLKTVSLYNSHVSDKGLRHLKGLSKLTTLELSWTSTTDEGLKHLADLTQLEALGLGYTKITDAGLAHLRKMEKLRILDIYDDAITEVGLEYVIKLKQLRKLRVSKNVSLERLRKEMPDCEIINW